MQKIFITNTLSRKKDVLETVNPNAVKMYACGVTVYDHCHIGHAVQAVFFDTIRRFLEYVGYDVTYVRNYTDVDDKIINKARELGISAAKLARDMIDSAEDDMKSIGCKTPTHSPKVSQMIPEIISMVQTLIDKGAAYAVSSGDVYYRVRQKSDYGKLSNQNLNEMRTGTRELSSSSEKEDELDFALWKKDDVPEASWDSPWGRGRPGWHIECSVMAKHFLGDTFDIHGGGRDLVFPHHENEIAQSESANDRDFARYWIHCGLLTINKQKMSKSLGNHLFIKDFLKEWPSEVLRLGILQHHYSSNIDFSREMFATVHKRLYYYYKTCVLLDRASREVSFNDKTKVIEGFEPELIRQTFIKAMSDDFNTSSAVGELNKTFKKANELLQKKKSQEKSLTCKYILDVTSELFNVFGILQEDYTTYETYLKESILPSLQIEKAEIELLIEQRNAARKDKNYQRSDEIRDNLNSRGIEIMDTLTGTQWGII